MISMRAMPIVAIITTVGLASFGLTLSATAQTFGAGAGFPGAAPGMGFPGGAPGMGFPGAAPPPQQQQQMPPCFQEFSPLRAEAEKRAGAIKVGMEKKLPREEICNLFKTFSAAEAKVVNFIIKNAQSCGIPPEAATQMKANHTLAAHAEAGLRGRRGRRRAEADRPRSERSARHQSPSRRLRPGRTAERHFEHAER